MNTNLILTHADLRALPYQDESFHRVVSGGTLNELTDLPGTLQELSRVLRPGGVMWGMYLTRADTGLGRLGQGMFGLSGLRFYRPEELARTAREAGLEPLKAQYRGRVALALFRKLNSSGTTEPGGEVERRVGTRVYARS